MNTDEWLQASVTIKIPSAVSPAKWRAKWATSPKICRNCHLVELYFLCLCWQVMLQTRFRIWE